MHRKVIRGVTYYYTSVREDGRIKTIYLGRTEDEARRREAELKGEEIREPRPRVSWSPRRPVIYLGIAVLVIVALFFGSAIVGYLVSVTPAEEGVITLDFTMQAGDFLPGDTVIEISFENQTTSLTLADFLERSGSGLVSETGDFYSKEVAVSGSGEGYGIRGEKTEYPEVSFRFNLSAYELVVTKTPYNVTDTIVTLTNETTEVFNETLNMTVNQTVTSSETTEVNRTVYNITEELVFLESGIFSASCSFYESYSANARELIDNTNATNYSVALIPGSVVSGNKTLNDSYIFLKLVDNTVIAETDYSEAVEGYGEGFTGDSKTFSLNLQELGVATPAVSGEYAVITRVTYKGSVLEETSKKVTVEIEATETCIDNDGDGFDNCQPDMDCDDTNPLVNPSAKETCDDGIDNNCDSLTDEEDPICSECRDRDKDGYDICEEPIDCDDMNPAINPGAKDVCGNLIDEDCDGYDKPCIVSLSKVIRERNIEYVAEEVERKIAGDKQARVIIKLKDASIKPEIEKRVVPEGEVKNYISAVVSEERIVGLLNVFTDDIELVQIDHPIELVLDDVVNQTGVWKAWDLGVTGKGQTVCVIDSGIDYNHPNLSGNYIGGYDFVNDDSDPMDDYGHGTYVSGIVAGIAKNSKILAVKVFGSDGVGYESDILAGIDYCVNNKDVYNISVMLMSFGGWIFNTSCYCDSNIVANESNFAVSQGIFTVAASGNDGEPYLKAPACGTNVTSVGAVDKNDNVADFTNIEPLLDLLAPGVDIESTKLGGGFEAKSGTSASAAVVAGIASLILENENLTPMNLQYRLRSTGSLIAHNGTDYPRVDAYSALTDSVTNVPGGQEGKQCEGTWEEYEPLFACCLSEYPPYPDSGCGGTEIEGLCVNAHCDMSCGSECEENYDCEQCVGGGSNKYYNDPTCDDFCKYQEENCYCDYGTPICLLGAGCGEECDSNDDCGNGTGVCDTTTDCECDRVTDCTYGCLYIRDSSNNNVAIFDSYGSLDLKGTWSACPGADCSSPPANSFQIKDSGGTTKAYITSSGNFATPVIPVSYQWQPSCNPGTNAFQVKDSGGTTRAYINQNGGVCFMGWVNGNAVI